MCFLSRRILLVANDLLQVQIPVEEHMRQEERRGELHPMAERTRSSISQDTIHEHESASRRIQPHPRISNTGKRSIPSME